MAGRLDGLRNRQNPFRVVRKPAHSLLIGHKVMDLR